MKSTLKSSVINDSVTSLVFRDMSTTNKSKRLISQLLGESSHPEKVKHTLQTFFRNNAKPGTSVRINDPQDIDFFSDMVEASDDQSEGGEDLLHGVLSGDPFNETKWVMSVGTDGPEDSDDEFFWLIVMQTGPNEISATYRSPTGYAPTIGPIPLIVNGQENPDLLKYFTQGPSKLKNLMGQEFWGFPEGREDGGGEDDGGEDDM